MVQAALPLHLLDRFARARARWAAALEGAGRGDFSRSHELEAVSRYLGRLVAAEAKALALRGPAAFGQPVAALDSPGPRSLPNASLLELSLLVDRAFPELRGWNEQVALRRYLRRREVPRGVRGA
jgi:hypothetical protein